jgi:hypothetical protein
MGSWSYAVPAQLFAPAFSAFAVSESTALYPFFLTAG